MENTGNNKEAFSINIHKNGIATIQPNDKDSEYNKGYLAQATHFVDQLEALLAQDQVKAVIYTSLFPHTRFRYKRLFEDEQRHKDYSSKLYKLLQKVAQLQQQTKPLIAYVNSNSTGIDLSIHLWAHYKLIKKEMTISFPESTLGLFPGFAAISNSLSCMPLTQAYDFLVEGHELPAETAVATGLFTAVVTDLPSAMLSIEQLIHTHNSAPIAPAYTSEDLQALDNLSSKTNKRTRGLIPGTNACLHIITSLLHTTHTDPLLEEAKHYQQILADPITKAMVRTGYYHPIDSRRFTIFHNAEIKRIGIIGAGMMGAGIAYEAAKSGIDVILKDTTIAQAERGKTYSDTVASKQVELGRMSEASKNTILAQIKPVADDKEFKDLDVIIEAVFENMELKKTVIQQANQGLKENGFMATNTTSLLISELATASTQQKDFVGMHFFSPVDRMKLVEIVKGKNSSEETIEKAIHLANKLGKTPIIVHDGPGFFTSRVFFNYLLEAISMLLEGIPGQDIEEQAWKAGFGSSPLAVLDAISLPLMLHVYDQLPSLSTSQLRAQTYLQSLVNSGRTGRKAKQGFYNYGEHKTLWQDPELPITDQPFPKETIAKRLLHVMALDSYRCLDEGLLTDPSDGDLGSTLGIGFPTYTGGVFSYIDQITLPQFVADCQTFASKGEQWQVPTSLQQLAQENFRFYLGFKSNWKEDKNT